MGIDNHGHGAAPRETMTSVSLANLRQREVAGRRREIERPTSETRQGTTP